MRDPQDSGKALAETARRFSSRAYPRNDGVFIYTSSCSSAPGYWELADRTEEAKLLHITIAERYDALTAESTLNRKTKIDTLVDTFDKSPRTIETAIAEFSVTARSDAVK
jgi:hypothetical protein